MISAQKSLELRRGSARLTPAHSFAAPPTIARLCQAHQRLVISKAETDVSSTESAQELSEAELKKAKAERLRAAEKFMVVGGGKATCKGCGYQYNPDKGDPEFPIPRGVQFSALPADYCCPICGAPKDTFESEMKVVAGFAENQNYGFGTNSMTGDQKQLLIYGSLFAFFALFIAGYGLE